MPTSSPSLRKVVSEDRKDMGCMAGILHIFDRRPSFSGRNCGCRWTATRNGQIVATASGRVYRELRCNPAYDMSVDSQPRTSSMDHLDQPKTGMDNARNRSSWEAGNNGLSSVDKSSSKNKGDNNSFRNQKLVEPVQTTKPHLSFYIQDSLPFEPSFGNKTPQKEVPSSLSFRSQSQNPKVSGPQLRASVDAMLAEKTPDIKDVVYESLHSYQQQRGVPGPQENGTTTDCDTWATLLLKRQVSSGLRSGRDKKSEMPCKGGGRVEQLIAHSDLPCCLCSVNTRTGRDMHIDGCPMQVLLDSTEKKEDLTVLPNDNVKLSKLLRCLEGDEISRLSVELEDGPSISTSSSHRNPTVDPLDSYKPLDNPYNLKEVRDPPCPPGFDIKDAHRASLQCRDGDWFQFDGCNDLLSAASYPRLSVDDGTDDVSCKNSFSAARGDHQTCERRLETNVVARLMGLEKFPISEIWKMTPPQNTLFSRSPLREAKLVHGLLHYKLTGLSELPQARLPDKFSQMSDRGGLGSCQKQEAQWDSHSCEAHELRSTRSPSSLSPKFMEGMPLVFKKPDDASNALKGRVSQIRKQFLKGNTTATVQKSDHLAKYEPLYGDMSHRTCQPRLQNSRQECKSLKQILEGMQLKGLLDPSNDKQVQDLNSKSEAIIMPITHLQPQWGAELIQPPLVSSNHTITIFNKDQLNLEHRETPRLESNESSTRFNTRTHEEMMKVPKKYKPILLETNSQTVKSDLSIVVMKPIKTKIASKLRTPKSTLPTSTTCAGSKNGVTMKPAQRKPQRAQARSSNKGLKDGQDLSQQPHQLILYSTTPTIKSRMPPRREPNFLKPRLQCQCGFGSGSARTGEKRNLKSLSDRKFKPRLPHPSRKSERSTGTSVKLATHKIMVDTGKASTVKPCIEELGIGEVHVQLQAIEGEAFNSSANICAPSPDTLKLSANTASSDTPGELEVLTAEVITANQITGDKEEVPSGLQILPHFLVDKFELSQRLPTGDGMQQECSPDDGMEQPSPVSMHNNTAFPDEEPTTSLQRCTSASSFQVVIDALESNNECGSFFEDVDTEEHGPTTVVRRKLCFETDPNQQQQLCQSVMTSKLEIELPFDSDNRTVGNSGKTSTRRTSFADKEEERQFVCDLLVGSELTNYDDISGQECLKSKECSTTKENNKNNNKKKQKQQKELLEKRLLFDAVNEIASRKLPLFLNQDLLPYTPSFIHYPHHRHHQILVSVPETTTAQSFAQQVWDELQELPCVKFHDVYDTVHGILDKDIRTRLRQGCAEIRDEMREVALEVERRIFRELVSGVVAEFLRTRKAQNQNKQQQQTSAAKRLHPFLIRLSFLRFLDCNKIHPSIHHPPEASSSIHHPLVVSTIP
ncbi:unnamed protein product [Sphagnum troendelagicum]|uniref:DUF4378 domain-containing protein n=1 Tax=Sphagnum troendelagicum TaxID=128251 RepID=A0ABP0UZL7_9BRYO